MFEPTKFETGHDEIVGQVVPAAIPDAEQLDAEQLYDDYLAERRKEKGHRFVTALGGTLKLIADFGDEQLKIA